MEPFKHDAGIFVEYIKVIILHTVSTFSGKHLLEEIIALVTHLCVCVFAEGTLLQQVVD